MARLFLLSGSAFGFLSVALGAFAAHALKSRLDAYSLGVFQTGVQYQFFHALALVLVGLLALQTQTNFRVPGLCFLVGILVFSGSLYLLAFTGVKWLGAITPLGGVAFLVGWLALFVTVSKIVR